MSFREAKTEVLLWKENHRLSDKNSYTTEMVESEEKKLSLKEYLQSKEQMLNDLFDFLNVTVDESTKASLIRIFLNKNEITKSDLDSIKLSGQIKPEDRDVLFYALAAISGKKVVNVGWKGVVKKWLTKDIISYRRNSFDLFRLSKYMSDEKGGEKISIAYPGSGQDSAGYLTDLKKDYVSEVATFGIDHRVDGIGNKKVESAGITNRYLNGRFHDTVASHPEIHNHFDVFVIELTAAGGGIAIENFDQDVVPLLGDNGVVVITAGNGERDKKNSNLDIVDIQMDTKILESFDLLVNTGENIILKRKRNKK